MTWAILSVNIKGGTGKSTVAEQIAYALRDRGHDIGLMDADIDSANLATRLGSDKRVEFHGDHIIKPVDHDGMKLYSMENAFGESSFSQTGQFMGNVVKDMVQSSDWGDLDYLIVDCPPGSSDVFEQLVRALRANILGAVSVGISDAVDDTGRLVKVCNHNWVPIIGFIENMSGIYCHDGEVTCSGQENTFTSESHPVEPFGSGGIENFAETLGGNFLGRIPLCVDETDISEVASGTINNTISAIEESKEPPMPEDNLGDTSFIKNVWKTVTTGIKEINQNIPVNQVQDQFGVEDRDPLVIEMELTDAGPISDRIFSSIVLTVDGGKIRAIKKKTAKKENMSIEGGISITSQDLYDAIRGEKKVMRAVTGEMSSEPYSIIEAVKMGDAEVWGDKIINRLSVLDKILSDVVEVDEIQKAVAEG